MSLLLGEVFGYLFADGEAVMPMYIPAASLMVESSLKMSIVSRLCFR